MDLLLRFLTIENVIILFIVFVLVWAMTKIGFGNGNSVKKQQRVIQTPVLPMESLPSNLSETPARGGLSLLGIVVLFVFGAIEVWLLGVINNTPEIVSQLPFNPESIHWAAYALFALVLAIWEPFIGFVLCAIAIALLFLGVGPIV